MITSKEQPAQVQERRLSERTIDLFKEDLVAVREIRGLVFETRWTPGTDDEGQGLGIMIRRPDGDDNTEGLASGESLKRGRLKSTDLVVGHGHCDAHRSAEMDKPHNDSP